MKRLLILGLAVLALSSCESITEEFNDADISFKDDSPAEVYNMPEGYSNFATKCDKFGNRIYVTRNEDGRAMAVVPDDPTCPPYHNQPS